MITTREINLKTAGDGDTIDITPQVGQTLSEVAIKDGTLTLFVTGSTAGLTLMEYESGLIHDFRQMWQQNVPSNINYKHDER